ncbi:TolB domain-containing protein [Bacillus sp. MRMR6]|uniref:TolB family protein n=1 Tax=Bacillus sp. MRMR6 TaxID=1928617 RepID=UPI000953636B|nr:TolB domain-containing protein [Bacillus sp. MRMR6]OLS35846.1 TolB domain-containing protein [Bacillus sp. MRMR6]
MRKLISILLLVIMVIPGLAKAESTLNVAFIRDGYLWTLMNGKEEKITTKAAIYHYDPQWSPDGKWILYQIEPKENTNVDFQNEIWVYSLETKQHKRITPDGANPKWSPVENIVAFKSGRVLNVSNLDTFYNIALGVDDYAWFPDGKSFIGSSSASLHPDGWTNPKLYKIELNKDFDSVTSLTEGVKPLYTIPSEIKKGDVNLLAINASDFHFSPDAQWISFIVSPTASWSMDSNLVGVISADGKMFEAIDEIILHLDSPKWAPKKNLLGYISGGGRIVLGFKEKDMTITEMPAFKSMNLTPASFAELGFSWRDDDSLVVSRVKESEWSNDPAKRPNPSLYLIKMGEPMQIQISHPPKGYGDYQPTYIKAIKKLTWVRKKHLTDSSQNLWMADADGKNAQVWLERISGYDFYF